MANYEPNRPYKEGDVVYLARRSDGALKIGKAADIRGRHSRLCGYYNQYVEMLYTTPGYTELEKFLHDKFAEYRVAAIRSTNGSDWYQPVQPILDWFAEHAKPYQSDLKGGAARRWYPAQEASQ